MRVSPVNLPTVDELARVLCGDAALWPALTDGDRRHWRALAVRLHDHLAELRDAQPTNPSPVVDVFVPGEAAPQGSKRYLGKRGAKGITVESGAQRVNAWRTDVRDAVRSPSDAAPLLGPLRVDLAFALKRPLRTPMSRTPPAVKRPDIDKLERAALDAIGSAGVWRDDCQVVELHGTKRVAEVDETPGCRVTVTPL